MIFITIMVIIIVFLIMFAVTAIMQELKQMKLRIENIEAALDDCVAEFHLKIEDEADRLNEKLDILRLQTKEVADNTHNLYELRARGL